jgi:hypothetical protein
VEKLKLPFFDCLRGNFLNKTTDFDETFGDPREKEKEYDDDENLSQAWWRVFHRAILLVVSQNYHDRSESASESSPLSPVFLRLGVNLFSVLEGRRQQ